MDNALLSRMESLSSPEDKGGIKIRNHVDDGYEDLNILEDPSKPGSKVVKVEIKGDYSRLHSRNKHDVHLHHATSQPLLVSIVLAQMKMLANLHPISGKPLRI